MNGRNSKEEEKTRIFKNIKFGLEIIIQDQL